VHHVVGVEVAQLTLWSGFNELSRKGKWGNHEPATRAKSE